MSYTSPLPAPKPIQVAPMDMLLLATANATNGTQPHIVSGVAASSPDVATAVSSAQAAAQNTNISDAVTSLKGYSASDQQKVWDGLTAPQQGQLRSAGYNPPAQHRSLWGDFTHGVSDVAGAAGTVLSSRPVHDTLNALGSPLRAVQHVERTMFAVANQSPNDPTGGSGLFGGLGGGSFSDILHSLHSATDWERAWDETTNGEQYILPQIKRQVLQQYGQDTYNLAYQLATGKTPQQLLAALPAQSAQQTALAQRLQPGADPNLTAATRDLQNGHVSMGRMIVGAGFMDRHPTEGSVLSGGLDALFDWYGDPTVIGGKALKSFKAGRYVASTPEDVQRLYDASEAPGMGIKDISARAAGNSVRAAMAKIAEAVASNSLLTIQREFPSLKQAAEQLIAEQADTEQKVLEFFKKQASVQDLIKGSPADAVGPGGGILPHLSQLGMAKLTAKGAFQKVIDNWADANPASTIAHEIGDTDWEWDENDMFHSAMRGDTQVVSRHVQDLSPLDRLKVGSGRFLRRATNLSPQKSYFNPSAPDAANVLRDIGLQFLPADVVDKVITAYAKDPDLGGKWRIYRSLMLQMGHAAGLDRNPDLWQTFVGKFASTDGRVYAADHDDEVMVDDTPIHAGVFKGDMAQGWAVPNFRELYTAGSKIGITQALTKGVNRDWMDSFMGKWRPLTLAHEGFGPRVAGEELGGFLAREGVVAYLRASALRTLAKNAARAAGETADPTLDDVTETQAAGIWNRLTGHLPATVTDSIRTPRDLYREYLADKVQRAFGSVAEKIAPADMKAAIEAHFNAGDLDVVPDELTAMHGYEPGQIKGDLDGQRFLRQVSVRGKVLPAEIVGTGDYKLYQPTDELFKQMWYRLLHTIATDDWGREALFKNRTDAERLDAVADRVQQDPMWRSSLRSVQNRAGAQVAAGEITERQAALDHAAVIIKTVDKATLSPRTGREIPGLMDFLTRGKPPTQAALNQVDIRDLPLHVRGPETQIVAHTQDLVNRATGWLFTHQIGPQINWMSRQPMYWWNYAKGREAYAGMAKVWRESGMSEDAVNQLVHQNARDRAIADTIKYVHNPELRSNLSTVTRNLAPFWFAQEQFYKRWARTFAYSPQAFRQAQLVSSGIRHSGFTHTDPETGQQYFVYPGSGLVQQVLVDALSPFGVHAQIPVEAGMVGQVNMLNPGLERLGLPSWGPLLTVPMNGIKQADPHLSAAIDKIEGPVAADSGYMKALLPTTVAHAVEAAVPSLDSAQYASARMQAIQALEATGNGMSTPAVTPVASMQIPNPKPGDYVLEGGVGSSAYVYQPDGKWVLNDATTMQKYLDKVNAWARIFLVTRMIYGFAAPAAPETQFNPSNLHTDLNRLLSEMPFDEAINTFLQLHPNATPYTTFQSQNTTGGFLPSTTAAMKFIDDNPKLVSDFSLAAPYFIPANDATGPYSQQVYTEQMQEGLRQRKDPATFYTQVVYNAASRIYFAVEDQKNQLLASHAGPTQQIDDQWTQWSEQFMQANPIFADQYSTQGATTRAQIMDQVGAAVNSKAAPVNEQTAALGVLYQTYVAWQQLTGNYGNPNQPAPSASTALNIDEQYAQWLQTFVAQNPGVQPLVDRAIRPDLSKAINSLAAQGVAITI